ncbi:MAG TPA: glycosyltransferase family 4 protein [Mariprofundaceae bacterium]|nr:glycosyltransferase family 4 protein [Mariprofundaceae bacterium]
MPRLIIISNTSWNLFNFRLPLMAHLREAGFDVVAAAPHDEYSAAVEAAGFRYIELPMNNKGTNPLEDLGLMLRLSRIFRAEKPDVILTYTAKPNIYGALIAGLMSISVIPNISGLGNVFIRKSPVTGIVKFLYRLALRFSGCVFFQNQDDVDLFVELGLVERIRAKRIPGSGINTSTYAPVSDMKQKHAGCIFLLVARMLWDKGVGEFVEAARLVKKSHPEARFQLLGFLDVENPQAIAREQMQQWVDEGVVEYLGVSDDVKSHMLAANCIVLPSYREGLPRTMLEGASLGKPLIATDVPGCRDVIEDRVTGFLCELKNCSDLAEKMEKMIHLPPTERATMGELGREKVIREFDEKIVLDAYMRVVRQAIHGNRPI